MSSSVIPMLLKSISPPSSSGIGSGAMEADGSSISGRGSDAIEAIQSDVSCASWKGSLTIGFF